jgi:hypothetical protein
MAHFTRLHSSGEGEHPHLSELGRTRLTQTCLVQFAASISKKTQGFYDVIQEGPMDLGIAGLSAIVCAASQGLGKSCASAL